MIRSISILAALAAPALLAGCEAPKFTTPLTLGGVAVAPEVLNEGHEQYMHYCRTCHGELGDGKGPSAAGYRPPPRDFTKGVFKFASVRSGELPTDEDFKRIITGGLHGTPMLEWYLPPETLNAVIQYIKTFSPAWQTTAPGEPIPIAPDPWGAEAAAKAGKSPDALRTEAVARGKAIYHGFAQCWACHPAYATKAEMFDASVATRKTRMMASDFRDDLYGSVAKMSEAYGVVILPPDFLRNPVRSASSRPPETPTDFFRIIGAGIGGTAMPTWIDSTSDVFTEGDIWAMAYYVQWLVSIRDTAEAEALRATLATQPAFAIPPDPGATPPAPPGPDGTAAPATGAPGSGAPAPATGAPASGAPAPATGAPASGAPAPASAGSAAPAHP